METKTTLAVVNGKDLAAFKNVLKPLKTHGQPKTEADVQLTPGTATQHLTLHTIPLNTPPCCRGVDAAGGSLVSGATNTPAK